MDKITGFSPNKKLYPSMLSDIKNAKKKIYLETYIFSDDEIGRQFRDALAKKAKEGVEVRILIDAFGSAALSSYYFSEAEKYGAKVEFFRRLKWGFWLLEKLHHRDHRKLLLIDGNITYLGSANIDEETLEWQDFTLRIEDEGLGGFLSEDYLAIFFDANRRFINRRAIYARNKKINGWQIVPDAPVLRKRNVYNYYLRSFAKAQREIIIENPYVILNKKMIDSLEDLRKMGRRIVLIVSQKSDIWIMKVLGRSLAARLKKKGIDVLLYPKEFIHAKILLIDNKYFLCGSSNLDYRSLIFQFELNLAGKNRQATLAIREHLNGIMRVCEKFDLAKWEKRSLAERLAGKLFSFLKYLL